MTRSLQSISEVYLEEVLERFPGLHVNADLKQREPSIVAAVVAAVRRAGAEARVLLTSFRTGTLREIRGCGYRGPIGLSMLECAGLVALPSLASREVAALGASAAQMPARLGPLRIASRALVERCHALDLRVDFFTVNEPGAARALLELGADGIMSDDPGRIASVVRPGGAATGAARTTARTSTAG